MCVIMQLPYFKDYWGVSVKMYRAPWYLLPAAFSVTKNIRKHTYQCIWCMNSNNPKMEKFWGSQPLEIIRNKTDISQKRSSNCQCTIVNGRWATVNGQLPMVNGQMSMVNGQLSMVNCQL